jgi:hypothetical protein
MPRDVSKDRDRAYFKGEILTVEELRKRFSLAVTINNADIIEMLLKADHPLTTKEMSEVLGLLKSAPLNVRMRKLFKEKLVVRFHLGANCFGYLLSEKGFENYKKTKELVQIEEKEGRIIIEKGTKKT